MSTRLLSGLGKILFAAAFVAALSASDTKGQAPNAEALVRDARAASARCDNGAAFDLAGRALQAARRETGFSSEAIGFIEDDLGRFGLASGRAVEAETHAREAVRIVRGARGADSLEAAAVATNLAGVLIAVGKFDEADRTLSEATTTLERLGAPAQSRLLAALKTSSQLERARDDDAASLAAQTRAAAIAERLGDRAQTADALIDLAEAQNRMLDTRAATATLGRAQGLIGSAANPSLSARVKLVQGFIAVNDSDLGVALQRLNEAAAAGGGATTCGRLLGPSILMARGNVRILRREGLEAAEDFRAALQAYETLGFAQPHRTADAMYGLAIAQRFNGAYDEARRLFDSAAQQYVAAFGPTAIQAARAYSEKAMMLADMGRGREAVAEARRAAQIVTAARARAPLDEAYVQAALGFALQADNQNGEAAAAFRRALTAFEARRGARSADLAPGLRALGEISLAQNDAAGALPYLERALAIQNADGARTGLGAAYTLSLIADARQRRGDAQGARAASREAVDVLAQRVAVGQQALSEGGLGEQRRARAIFERDLDLVAGGAREVTDEAAVERMFLDAQLAVATRTAQAVAQMAARFRLGDSELARAVRSRQDLVQHWQALDDRLIGSLTREDDAGGPQERAALSQELAQLRTRIQATDADIARRFQPYAELTNPAPLRLADARRLLRANEALLAFVIGERRSFLVVVRRDRAVGYPLAIERGEVAAGVAQLRRDLDPVTYGNRALSFDGAQAYRLYQALLAPAEPALAGIDTLLVAPDAALTGLPLGVLLTAPAGRLGAQPDAAQTPWLAERYAIGMLPAVSSLRALRVLATGARAARPFAGIGDPVLPDAAADESAGRGVQMRGVFRGAMADPNALRANFPRLRSTATELDAIARALRAGAGDLYLAERASEPIVKAAPLNQYRVIAFATHGVTAGLSDITGVAEPGLVLTPPTRASRDNDGLLTASEIAALDLNADWVILSACSTAADDGSADGEGLSGLAKAFLYSGARALMVTHWDVYDTASEQFTTRMVASGRSPIAAAHDAQLALMREPRFAHPTFWAPFFVVGVDPL